MLMCRLAILLNSFNELNKANQHEITIYYTFVYHIFGFEVDPVNRAI